MAELRYNVIFEEYAKRHYIKKFEKKYKKMWEMTMDDIVAMCQRINLMLLRSQADLIKDVDGYKLVKLDFKVEGTHKSAKAAGNRCILFVDEKLKEVRVLLVYSKNVIGEPGETVKWKKIVREEYRGMWGLVSRG